VKIEGVVAERDRLKALEPKTAKPKVPGGRPLWFDEWEDSPKFIKA
jgi:hypothetical protein